jgi:O-antigen/teichoic acid export membrane protein
MTYLLCLIEQGLVSGLNIGLNIWLIRVGGSELYGVYAFWFNVALLAGSVQYGLTISHLLPLPPGPGTAPQRVAAEAPLLAASLALLAVAAVAVAAVMALVPAGSPTMLGGAVLLVPAYLGYQYARALAFSRGAVRIATATTAAVVALTVGGLGADALWGGHDGDADRVLLIAGGAYAIAGAAATWRLAAGLGPIVRPFGAHLRRYLPFASLSRWSLIGIVCFEMMNRTPNFAVTGWLGAGGLGRMSATGLPARVPILMVAGLQPAFRNDLARLRERGAWRRFTLHSALGSLAAAAANLAWAVPVGLAWPMLARLLFHGRFADDAALGMLWIASQGLGSVIVLLATAFQVCGAFRMIGLADIAGAAATVAGLAVLLPAFGIAGTIGAMVLGQACYLAAVLAQWHRLKTNFPVDSRQGLALSEAND